MHLNLNTSHSKILAVATLMFTVPIYAYHMFYRPYFEPINEELSQWDNLMGTLYHWQSLNASIIAFLSAIIVVLISQNFLQREASAKRRVALNFLLGEKRNIHTYTEQLRIAINMARSGVSRYDDYLNRKLLTSIEARIEQFVTVASSADHKNSDDLVQILRVLKLIESDLERLFEDEILHKHNKNNFDYVNCSDEEKEQFQHDMQLEENDMNGNYLKMIRTLNNIDSKTDKILERLEAQLQPVKSNNV